MTTRLDFPAPYVSGPYMKHSGKILPEQVFNDFSCFVTKACLHTHLYTCAIVTAINSEFYRRNRKAIKFVTETNLRVLFYQSI